MLSTFPAGWKWIGGYSNLSDANSRLAVKYLNDIVFNHGWPGSILEDHMNRIASVLGQGTLPTMNIDQEQLDELLGGLFRNTSFKFTTLLRHFFRHFDISCGKQSRSYALQARFLHFCKGAKGERSIPQILDSFRPLTC